VRPIRIDRVEHNDDIDDRIIQELERASFAIADLTYARPSVYFEAGYAQRRIPVVYTCRRDHFRPRPNDENGNLRVHFDLQMKNIISWRDHLDRTFPKRLSKRIRYVISPILQQRTKAKTESEEGRQFRSLPLVRQKESIREVLGSELRAAGYKHNATATDDMSYYVSGKFRTWADNTVAWSGLISSGKRISFVDGVIPAINSVNHLQWIVQRDWGSVRQKLVASRIEKSKNGTVPTLQKDFFLCTTGTLPHSRISTAFPHFSYNPSEGWFLGEFSLRYNWREPGLIYPVRLHIIQKIKSLSALRTELQTRLRAIKKVENA
jgi:hypothetical protein